MNHLLKYFLLLFVANSFAGTTKAELHQLEARMSTIKKQLSDAEHARDKHYQALSKTEKQIIRKIENDE